MRRRSWVGRLLLAPIVFESTYVACRARGNGYGESLHLAFEFTAAHVRG